jgi:hypothetical protein
MKRLCQDFAAPELGLRLFDRECAGLRPGAEGALVCAHVLVAAGPCERRYAAAFGEATRHAAAAGFVLEQDVEEMVAVATAACPAWPPRSQQG